MQPVSFPGSVEVGKPKDMTDEQCFAIHAAMGIDGNGFQYFLTAWKPSYEDLQALNNGEPVYIKTLSNGLPPTFLFTLNESGEANV